MGRRQSDPTLPVGAFALTMSLLGSIALAVPAAAAQTEPVLPDTSIGSCPDGTISSVLIQNGSVFDLTSPSREGRLRWAYRLANTLHFRTRSEVIDQELLFEAGDCYDVDALRDSERLLRGFGFIARADIYGIRESADSIQVVVDTQDEWSTRIQPEVDSRDGVELSGLTLVEDNLFGTGRRLAIFYDRANDQRVYGTEFVSPQVLGTRTDLGLQAARTEVGYSYHQAIAYPFVGEWGKWAFRQQIGRDDEFFELLVPHGSEEPDRIWLPTRRIELEVGGAFRWGSERYRHALVGAALVHERISYPAPPLYPDSVGRPDVPLASFTPDWTGTRSTRALLLFGGRSVEFVRRRALETINGIEDLQLGVEGEISFGPTLSFLTDEDDVAFSAGLAGAAEPADVLAVGGQLALKGRRRMDADEAAEWADVVGELALWGYLRSEPESPNTLVASISAVGGWNGTSPFQLSLGSDSGLRGFPRHLDPGGRRVVASVEHRRYLGWPLPDLFDLGAVAFIDAGKIWPGDAPFGMESPVRATVGVGVRAAFPAGSRQTFRADIGVPLRGHSGSRGFVVSVGIGQVIGRSVTAPDPQILRSARYALTSSRFLYSGGWW